MVALDDVLQACHTALQQQQQQQEEEQQQQQYPCAQQQQPHVPQSSLLSDGFASQHQAPPQHCSTTQFAGNLLRQWALSGTFSWVDGTLQHGPGWAAQQHGSSLLAAGGAVAAQPPQPPPQQQQQRRRRRQRRHQQRQRTRPEGALLQPQGRDVLHSSSAEGDTAAEVGYEHMG